jgi:hypothetical protein
MYIYMERERERKFTVQTGGMGMMMAFLLGGAHKTIHNSGRN